MYNFRFVYLSKNKIFVLVLYITEHWMEDSILNLSCIITFVQKNHPHFSPPTMIMNKQEVPNRVPISVSCLFLTHNMDLCISAFTKYITNCQKICLKKTRMKTLTKCFFKQHYIHILSTEKVMCHFCIYVADGTIFLGVWNTVSTQMHGVNVYCSIAFYSFKCTIIV